MANKSRVCDDRGLWLWLYVFDSAAPPEGLLNGANRNIAGLGDRTRSPPGPRNGLRQPLLCNTSPEQTGQVPGALVIHCPRPASGCPWQTILRFWPRQIPSMENKDMCFPTKGKHTFPLTLEVNSVGVSPGKLSWRMAYHREYSPGKL